MNRYLRILLLAALLWTGALTLAQPNPTVITADNADQLTPAVMIGRGALHDMAWSIDGSTLAVATTLGVWLYDNDYLDADPIYVESPVMWVNTVAYSPDSSLLAFDAGVNQVALCHPHTGGGLTLLDIQEGPGLLSGVAWSGPATLTVYNHNGDAVTVDAFTGEPVDKPYTAPATRPQVLQISSATGSTAKGYLEGQSSAISVLGDRGMTRLEGFHTGILTLAFGPDGSTLAFGAYDGLIWWWDLDTMQYRQSTSRRAINGSVNAIAYSPDGSTLAAATSQYPFWGNPSTSAGLHLFDVESGALRQEINDSVDYLSAVAFSPDGTWIAAAGGSGDFTVRRWTLGEDAETEPLIMEAHSAPVRALVYTDDPPALYSGSDDGTVRLWDGAGIQRGTHFEGNGQAVYDLVIHPDGNRQAVAQGTQVWLRDTSFSGEFIKTYESSDNVVRSLTSVAISPDGTLLAAGGTEHRIFLWDVETGELLASLDNPSTHDVQDLAFSPDGTLLASASMDGAVWLWRVPQSLSSVGTSRKNLL